MSSTIVTVVVGCVAAGVVTVITFPKFLERIKRKSVESTEMSKLKSMTWVPIGSVKQLIIYPIMAGKEYGVTDCTFEEEGILVAGENKGVLRDKMFVIYDEDTHCVQTCRNFTLMFKLKVVDINKNTICLKDGEDRLMVDIKHSTLAKQNIVECKAWNNSSETLYYLECVDCGAEAASWVSNSLTGKNVGLRLGYFVNKTLKILTLWDTFCGLGNVRGLKKNVEYEMERDKEMPHCTLITQQSLEHVNRSLLRIKMPHDFGANLIITVQKPFAESQYGLIKIGDDVVISNVKPWKRPRVNPLQIPNDLRLKLMSIHCKVLSTGKVNVNDKVYIPIDSYE